MAKFLSVPKNIEAMYNAEYGEWNDDEHYIWYLQDEDISFLCKEKVFDLMNTVLGTMIDDYEDEDIYYQKLFYNKEHLYEKLNCCQCKKQVEQLKKMIEKAIESRTLLSITL